MPNPVVHFEIISKHPAKAQQFYRDIFGWSIDANNSMNYGLVAKGGKRGIEDGIGGPYIKGRTFVTVYAQVKSIHATLKKVKQLGGKVVIPRTVIPGMVTFAQFKDPDGHIIGIIE